MIRNKQQYNLLVIEDNLGDFVLVEDYLNDKFFNPIITHAINFKQALVYLLDNNFPKDAILLDISLPDIEKKELINKIMPLAGNCPVIILTGYSDYDFSLKSINMGITDYLLKDELNANLLHRSIVYAIERKKTILQLEESEKKYGDLFYYSPQPKWVFDTETFKFVQVNKAATELYGYTQEEYMNMTLMDIKSEDDVPKVQAAIKKRDKNNKVVKRTSVHYKKNGERMEIEFSAIQISINDKVFGLVSATDVTEKNLHQQNMMKAIIKTQEDERYEMGGELHDNVCQILGASKLYLSMLKSSLPDDKLEFYNECEQNIHAALNEIRNLSHRLAPAFFDDSTLEESFKKLFNTFNQEAEFEIVFNLDAGIGKQELSRELQLNLYRIVQEQLKNIKHYAKATLVEIDVIYYNHKLKLSIKDNGIGFNANEKRGGIGLANMKRRAELFAGVFEIESSPGNGCNIFISIPL